MPRSSHETEQANWARLQDEYGKQNALLGITSGYSDQVFRDFHQKYISKLKGDEVPETYDELEDAFRDYLGLPPLNRRK